MATVPVLVSGCARSGTGYMAALLTRLGVECGHERSYEPGRIRAAGRGRLDVAPNWPKGVVAESSWLAAPFLQALPRGTLVLHQVRHPLLVVRSKLRTRFFETPTAYRDFAQVHLPGLDSGSPLERAASYWIGWNSLVERAAGWTSLSYRRYRLEDVDERLLLELLAGIGRGVPTGKVARALRAVPRDANSRGDRLVDRSVRLAELASSPLSELEELARRYGYADPHSPPARRALDENLRLI